MAVRYSLSRHELTASDEGGRIERALKLSRDAPVVERCPAARLAELYALRARVWIGEGADASAFPGGEWRDAADAARFHWIGTIDGRIVAGASLSFCASITEMDEPEVYEGLQLPSPALIAAPCRVVADRYVSHRGFVRALLDAQDDASRAAGAGIALRQASPSMRRVLERRGWRAHGVARPDDRFPGVAFTVMSLEFERSDAR